MISIDVKIIAKELMPGLVNGVYNVNDGITVSDLLTLCEKECGVSIPEWNYKHIYPIFNGIATNLETAITESGTLYMCRTVVGG